MLKGYLKHHFDRVRSATDPAARAATMSDWITRETFLRGKPFSFLDHEYQKTILDDPAAIKFVTKCSQIGISELSVRRVIAKVNLFAEINAMYVLPTAAFASMFSSTRFATALDNSPAAKSSLYRTNSASIKRFFNESYIYMRGASRSGQAISVPVSDLTMDEVDFAEDQDVLTAFTSRMTHADAEIMAQWWFSTPTVNGYGITHLFDNSLQHVEMQRCQHCNHHFVPDYYKDVKLPGFNVPDGRLVGAAGHAKTDRQLAEFSFFTKQLLTQFDVDSAYLACPKCKKKVNQDIANRQFVVVNPDSNFEEHGYRISPFSAPKHMPPSKMIKTATMYKAIKDFVNNCLGLAHEDETTGLSRVEVDNLFRASIDYPEHPPYQVSGTDMGGQCAHLTAYPAPDDHLRIMTADLIPLSKFKEEFRLSLAQTNCISSIIDSLPYTDTVSEMQALVPRLFAAVYSKGKGLSLFDIKEVEEDETKASYGVRQVTVKRDALFDLVVAKIRAGHISFAPSTFKLKETIINHLLDMKRIEITNSDGDKIFTWRKSSAGVDHFMHALGYLILADFIKGLSTGLAPLPMLAAKMKLKTEV